MNLLIESSGETKIVRVKEPRLIYPMLRLFSARLRALIEGGTRQLVIDLSDVGYLDSASYGCLMDIHRLMSECNGTVKLMGLQPRVEEMGVLVGLTPMIETFSEEANALASFRASGE